MCIDEVFFVFDKAKNVGDAVQADRQQYNFII